MFRTLFVVLIEGINDNEDGRVRCLFAVLKGLNDTVLKLVLELPPARVQLESKRLALTDRRLCATVQRDTINEIGCHLRFIPHHQKLSSCALKSKWDVLD